MKFLCDVHISYKAVNYLNSLGFEAIHVNEILDKWNTKDKDICSYADANDFIVISKDHDFRDSYFINQSPKKLIKINLGNISNQELIQILSTCSESIKKMDLTYKFMLEVDKDSIMIFGF